MGVTVGAPADGPAGWDWAWAAVAINKALQASKEGTRLSMAQSSGESQVFVFSHNRAILAVAQAVRRAPDGLLSHLGALAPWSDMTLSAELRRFSADGSPW
jgi:hypothetical protein